MGIGLLPGDPLSPFLFILVTKVLHMMLEKVEVLGLIGGIQDILSRRAFFHLQFTDDTILFLRAKEKFVRNVRSYQDTSRSSRV